MQMRSYVPTPLTVNDLRRPTLPIDRQAGGLFLGWGPKV